MTTPPEQPGESSQDPHGRHQPPSPPPGEYPPAGGYPPPTYPTQPVEYPPPQPPPPPPSGAGHPASPPYPGQPGGYPGYQPPPLPPLTPLAGYGEPHAVPPGMFYDAASELVLPNGTELASHGRRIGSWFLSFALFIVTLGIGYIIWGLIVWSRGQTPTYQVLGMRCWRPDTNEVATWGWMALREVVGRFIEAAITIIAVASFIMFLVLRQRRTIHDYVAGTVVLYDPNKVLAPQA